MENTEVKKTLNTFLSFAGPFIGQMVEMAENSKAKKKALEEEYFQLVNLPRKKKKRRKKEILADYAFYASAEDTLFGDLVMDVLRPFATESRSAKQFREMFSEPTVKHVF